MELKEKSPESFCPLTILYSFEPLSPKRQRPTTAHQQCHPKRSRTNDNDEKSAHSHQTKCGQEKNTSETGTESKHTERESEHDVL